MSCTAITRKSVIAKSARRLATFRHRRSQASRAPSAMSRPPVTRSSHAFTRGRVSTAPSRSMNHAYAVSQTKPMAM